MTRVRTALLLAAAAIAAGAIVVVAAGGDEPEPSSNAAGACDPTVRRGVLPEWARAGFSDPRPRMPHVIGRDGEIAAIIFGDPLTSPPRPKLANKILWVSRVQVEPLSDLRIRAQLMRGDRAVGKSVRRTVEGGPGPSYVDLPEPGCWRLRLSWSGHADRMDLAYVPRG